MTAGQTLAFPGGRALAGWWRRLAPYRPRGLWVAHLLLHRIEALVGGTGPERLGPLELLALDLLAGQPGAATDALDSRLHVGPQVLHQVMRQLRSSGLVETAPGGGWSCTALGEQARQQGAYPRRTRERQVFHFLESGYPGRPPHFLDLHQHRGLPWPADGDWHFDPKCLEECLARPADWKRRFGFPEGAQELVRLREAGDPAVPDWQKVILDHPERLPVALVRSAGDGGEELLGFSAREDGWLLETNAPAFRLGPGWRDEFGPLTDDPPLEQWYAAWLAWCQSRGLRAPADEPLRLERQDQLLRVHVSRNYAGRLSTAVGAKNEVWLLAGEGRTRAAGQVEVVADGG